MELTKKKKMLIAASFAGLIATVGASMITSNAHAEDKVACYGVNQCKGAGECGGKGHACGGKNACKGQGVVMLDKEACLNTDGGRLTEEA